jgi:hypothetical protein
MVQMAVGYLQKLEGLDLTIEQATQRTPDKRLFHVFLNGELAGSSQKLSDAQKRFRRLRDQSGWQPPSKPELTPEEMLVREREMQQRVAHLEYWAISHKFRGGGRPKRK